MQSCLEILILIFTLITTSISTTTSIVDHGKQNPGGTLSFPFQRKTSYQLFSIPQIDLTGPARPPKNNNRQMNIKEFVTLLSQSENSLEVFWAGKGVILALVKKLDSTSSTIYISRDNGGKFEDATHLLKRSRPTIISRIFSSPQNNGQLVLIDEKHKLIFTTSNYASSFKANRVSFVPKEIIFDPRWGQILVAYEAIRTKKPINNNIPTNLYKLWVSEDFGVSWTMLQEYVKSVSWDAANLQLYIHKLDNGQRGSVLTWNPLFQFSQDPVDSLEDVDEFQIKDDYMFATRKSGNTTIQLWVSYKKGEFFQASFPVTKTDNEIVHFQISHVATNGRIFVTVTHNDSLSNLYLAEPPSTGATVLKFSLSLERTVICNARSAVQDASTFTDIYNVESSQGVYMGNVFNGSSAEVEAGGRLVSMVTFDNGVHWEPVKCATCQEACTVQLGYQSDAAHSMAPPTLSKSSTPDLILATGKIQNSPLSLLISTDGAKTWKQSLEGNYLFEISADSSIILAVKLWKHKMADVTDTLLYSTDKGSTWYNFKFYTQNIAVIGLMAKPSDNSAKRKFKTEQNSTDFLIVGSTISKNKNRPSAWLLIEIDMKFKTPDRSHADDIMILTSKDTVFRMDLNNVSRVDPLPLSMNGRLRSVEFDIRQNIIYWATFEAPSIRRKSLDADSTTEEILMVLHTSRFGSLSFDWMARNLYVCDEEAGKIQVLRTDVPLKKIKGMQRTILQSPHLEDPRDTAVHPEKGFLFWTDYSTGSKNPCIGRSWLDGSHVQKIIQNLEAPGPGPGQPSTLIIERPISLAIDFEEDRIFWNDAYVNAIASADLDGSNIRTLIRGNSQVHLSYGVGVLRDFVYWTDWSAGGIYGLDKINHDQPQPQNDTFLVKKYWGDTWLFDFKVFGNGMQEGSNVCSLNTTCSHICLSLPQSQSHVCVCPDIFIGQSNTTGECLCPEGQSISAHNGRCILDEDIRYGLDDY